MKYTAVLALLLLMAPDLAGQASPRWGIFTEKKALPATTVKNQNRTSTCWCFSGISLIESELLRLGRGNYDLSEMYVVRCVYQDKAIKYVRMHGTIGFSGGGEFNDVTEAITKYGIVPQSLYSGLQPGDNSYDHIVMDSLLKAYVDRVIANENGILSPDWYPGFCSLLDSCLGPVTASFTFNGKTYTPQSYARELALDMNGYVLLSSFSHHPMYGKYIIELPDNWSWGEVYNIRIDELTEVIDHALASGYTVAWAADVSEPGFSRLKGVAYVTGDEQADSIFIINEDRKLNQARPLSEQEVTQEMRQEAFNNYATTDDHGMHIIGVATDPYGEELYVVKNSWGTHAGPNKGYFFVTKAYVRYKTTVLMLNKKALPVNITNKIYR
jgi:bleomycin hydrolase